MAIMSFLIMGNLITRKNLDMDELLGIFSLLLGILGYIGLIMLLVGLHKTKLKIKLALLISGLTGYFIFFYRLTPQKSFIDWFLKTAKIEALIGLSPIITSFLFSILIVKEIIKKRLLTQG